MGQSLALSTFPIVCETRRLAEVIHFRWLSPRVSWLLWAGESWPDEHLFLFGRRTWRLGDKWLTLSPASSVIFGKVDTLSEQLAYL